MDVDRCGNSRYAFQGALCLHSAGHRTDNGGLQWDPSQAGVFHRESKPVDRQRSTLNWRLDFLFLIHFGYFCWIPWSFVLHRLNQITAVFHVNSVSPPPLSMPSRPYSWTRNSYYSSLQLLLSFIGYSSERTDKFLRNRPISIVRSSQYRCRWSEWWPVVKALDVKVDPGPAVLNMSPYRGGASTDITEVAFCLLPRPNRLLMTTRWSNSLSLFTRGPQQAPSPHRRSTKAIK